MLTVCNTRCFNTVECSLQNILGKKNVQLISWYSKCSHQAKPVWKMADFPRRYFQDIYYVILLITKNWWGKLKSAGFYILKISHAHLNSCAFFELLLASDIFSLALLFIFIP